MKIDLIQPRHSYADPLENGQSGSIYTPNMLWTAAARLKAVGHEVKLYDENLRPYDGEAQTVGVNFLGAPYIPEVQALQARVGKRANWLLGGQIFDPRFGLTDKQRIQLFGESSINGNKDFELQRVLGHEESLPTPEETSLVPIYEQVPDEDFEAYLKHEMSFYLSQGCKEKCTFCTAPKNQDERYRNADILEKDFEYLVQRALRLGINSLKIYVSNLDLFQNPPRLKEWGELIIRMKEKYPAFNLEWRALSTTTSFNTEKARELLPLLRETGLKNVGFGIDGAREEVWASTHKQQTLQDCIEAMEGCYNAGLTPEALMVFGHPKETAESLEAAVSLTLGFNRDFKAIPRPHVAKSVYPGNGAWRAAPHQLTVQTLMSSPVCFQALDFTAKASSISHPDPKLRALVNDNFRTICDIPGNLTQVVYPLAPEHKKLWDEYRILNRGKFDL